MHSLLSAELINLLAFFHKQHPLIGDGICGQQCATQFILAIPATSSRSAVAAANLLAVRHFAHQVFQCIHLRLNAQCRRASQWSRAWRLAFSGLHRLHGGHQSVGIIESISIHSVQILHDGILSLLLWVDQVTASFTACRLGHLHGDNFLLVFLKTIY